MPACVCHGAYVVCDYTQVPLQRTYLCSLSKKYAEMTCKSSFLHLGGKGLREKWKDSCTGTPDWRRRYSPPPSCHTLISCHTCHIMYILCVLPLWKFLTTTWNAQTKYLTDGQADGHNWLLHACTNVVSFPSSWPGNEASTSEVTTNAKYVYRWHGKLTSLNSLNAVLMSPCLP